MTNDDAPPENESDIEVYDPTSNNDFKESGFLTKLMNFYNNLSYGGSHLGQALFLLVICCIGGFIFILFFALQTPYQMTLVSNITNTTNTTISNATNISITIETTSPQVPTLTFWDSVYTIISVFGVGVLVGGASFFIGGLLGFLFGIPKTEKLSTSNGGTPPKSNAITDKYVENTNLEDVSDWLTKIIIGVGLVELTKIPEFLNQYSEMIAPALGGIPSSGAFGIAILVYYSIIGFLFVYLSTRGYLESELEKNKRMELRLIKEEKLTDEMIKADKMRIDLEYSRLKAEKLQYEKKIKELEQQLKGP